MLLHMDLKSLSANPDRCIIRDPSPWLYLEDALSNLSFLYRRLAANLIFFLVYLNYRELELGLVERISFCICTMIPLIFEVSQI